MCCKKLENWNWLLPKLVSAGHIKKIEIILEKISNTNCYQVWTNKTQNKSTNRSFDKTNPHIDQSEGTTLQHVLLERGMAHEHGFSWRFDSWFNITLNVLVLTSYVYLTIKTKHFNFNNNIFYSFLMNFDAIDGDSV